MGGMRLMILVGFLAGSLAAADISGNWEAKVETTAGSGTPSFVLKQEGEKLTGNYTGALGQAPLTGTVKGDAVEFSFEVSPGGEKVKVVYKGTVKSPTSMGGSMSIETVGDGTWTATKR
jgi:hypothetical protein